MLNDQIAALYATLKAMKPKDMTDAQFELLVLLEGQLEV
jgi:hypothetical protein